MSKPRICVGYHVGILEVEEATANRKNGYIVWRCRCECGNELYLDTRTLQRGTVLDCGCVTKVPSGVSDLTGRRFGKLIAEEATGQRLYQGVVWRCVCDCGKVAYVSSHQLLGGYTKSCGCLGRPRRKELTGARFGKLTVIGYEEKRAGMHRWRCICDCGKETVVGQTLLQSGKTKSCGCIQSTVILENMKFIDGTSVTALEATKNRRISTNTSGYTGVYQNRKRGKWSAQITFKRKKYHLGDFDRIEDAVRARRQGEEMHDRFLEWYYAEYLPGKEYRAMEKTEE